MEDTQKSKYEIIVTATAEISFYEILDYLYDHYPIERAEEVANQIRDTTKKLAYHAERGIPEPKLKDRVEDFRFILYKRTSRADIKIIYYIDRPKNVVYVTDFFPTEMDNNKITIRS